VQKLAKAILNKVFSLPPHQNAFENIVIGANSRGVLVATTDDQFALMQGWHFAELGQGSLRWPHGCQTLQIQDDYLEELS
jgi:hypothetical protein